MGEDAMTDQGSTPPPPDPNQPGGYGATPPGGGYGAPPPPGGYGAPPPPGGYGQPTTGGYGQPAGPPPPNHLVWAILTTVLCCLPLGVASIVFAAQVNSKWAAGDVAGARESSEKAKKFAIWSAIAGVVVAVIYIVLLVAVGVGSDSTS
jgi:hypothetical protein